MSDFGPRCRAGQGRNAGIAEQVENFWCATARWAACAHISKLEVQPLPVRCLLGKERQMPEWREAPGEPHIAPGQREGVDGLAAETPASGLVLVVRIEHGVGTGEGVWIARRPPALRLGPHHGVGTIAFQLLAVPAVQQGIVRPGRGQKRFGRGRQNGSHGAD